jgi:hypothetical protein
VIVNVLALRSACCGWNVKRIPDESDDGTRLGERFDRYECRRCGEPCEVMTPREWRRRHPEQYEVDK